MDQHLRLRNHPSVIGPTSDFTYRWGMNAGLTERRALELSLAVAELVTDVVRFAFPREEATFEVTFRQDLSTAEVIITERGEPFDPSRYVYDADHARSDGNFDGAGFEVVRHFVDDFAFINKGRQGKEFRLVQKIESKHIADLLPADVVEEEEPPEDVSYTLSHVGPEDAEEIAKLIYRTYGYTYVKEELYFPEKIERALLRGDKFGVMIRTDRGKAVAYFAVLRSTDSQIGEVGEAVVDVDHRRKGLMTQMLEALIEEARERKLLGVFGEAVTSHPISQRVNYRFDMHSTSLLLAAVPSQRFRGLVDDYPQPISVIIDFRPLEPYGTVTAYLPPVYEDILRTIYDALGATVAVPGPEEEPMSVGRLPKEAEVDTRILYRYHHAEMVVQKAGADIGERARQTISDINDTTINAAYVDLPLDDPHTPDQVERLREAGFVFCGLMPRYHNERDHLRMQRPLVDLDPDHIDVFSDLAHALKARVAKDLSWTTTDLEVI